MYCHPSVACTSSTFSVSYVTKIFIYTYTIVNLEFEKLGGYDQIGVGERYLIKIAIEERVSQKDIDQKGTS